MMKKSLIKWCDFSWNPITGCGKHCSSCFAISIAKRFTGNLRLNLSSKEIEKDPERGLFVLNAPFHTEKGAVLQFPVGFNYTFHKYRLSMIRHKKKPANIYVGSIGDMFGDGVPTEWIMEVFKMCQAAPWHNYLFMTCNPKRYAELAEQEVLPTGDNFWYGSRINLNQDVFVHDGYHTYIWIEAIEKFKLSRNLPRSEWIIIGCQPFVSSKQNIAARQKHIEDFINRIGDTPLFMKDNNNMKALWKEKLICQYPALLQHPKDKPIPRCNECKYCRKFQEGKRGIRHICTHQNILAKHRETDGLHIKGRFARTSPPWCPRR